MARPHIEPHVELNEDYKRFDQLDFTGSHYKVLSLDTDSGSCTLKIRYDAGFTRKPGMSYSDVEIFVLNGMMTVGDQTCLPGHYFFVPAGMVQGAITVPQGCEALIMYNHGEPTFVESDEGHPLAQTGAYVSVNAYNEMPWGSGSIVSPSVATGCMIKVLSFDPLSEAITFCYCMTPQFAQDNISYHDAAEESYHIWGTSWMMQFGDLPTGGYFWRPPWINHGSFASDMGILAFGRTDSKLHNYFHFNPWTSPEENRDRAAAQLARFKPDLFNWAVSKDGHNHPHDFENPDAIKHTHYI
jgi:hypothetical protein